MPITLDPAKQFVEIRLFYLEQIPSRGGDVNYIFINSKEEMEEWISKGYKHENEIKTVNPKGPGMPVQDQSFDPSKVIYTMRTKWKRMSWKDQNIIFSKCLKTVPGNDGVPRTELDTITYRDMKIKQCLKEWDIKNARGEVEPVSPQAIDSLIPEIVSELINAFERYTEANADDLGESRG